MLNPSDWSRALDSFSIQRLRAFPPSANPAHAWVTPLFWKLVYPQINRGGGLHHGSLLPRTMHRSPSSAASPNATILTAHIFTATPRPAHSSILIYKWGRHAGDCAADCILRVAISATMSRQLISSSRQLTHTIPSDMADKSLHPKL